MNTKRLFDESAKAKRRCRPGRVQSFKQSFARNLSLGVPYCIILLALDPIRILISWTEVFPTTIPEPTEARLSDLALDIIECLMAIAYQFIDWRLLIVLTGLAALLFKLLRAWMIAKHVANSGVDSNLDRFNFVGPGVVAALTSMLTLPAGMRRTEKHYPAFQIGEVFFVMHDYGDTLENHERELLVLSVLQSTIASPAPFSPH